MLTLSDVASGRSTAFLFMCDLHVQAVTKGLGYAALGIILAAPFLSAFRVNAGAAHRRKMVAAIPSHAIVIEADQGQAQAQAQAQVNLHVSMFIVLCLIHLCVVVTQLWVSVIECIYPPRVKPVNDMQMSESGQMPRLCSLFPTCLHSCCQYTLAA